MLDRGSVDGYCAVALNTDTAARKTLKQIMAEPHKPIESAVPAKVLPVKFVHRNEDRVSTFHAEGAWVVANPQGFIRLGFYTENPPIPSAVIQPVAQDGTPNGEPRIEGGDDPNHFVLMRDFQCNVVTSLSAAIQIHAALGNFIKIAQEQLKQQIDDMQAQIKQAAQKTSAQQAK